MLKQQQVEVDINHFVDLSSTHCTLVNKPFPSCDQLLQSTNVNCTSRLTTTRFDLSHSPFINYFKQPRGIKLLMLVLTCCNQGSSCESIILNTTSSFHINHSGVIFFGEKNPCFLSRTQFWFPDVGCVTVCTFVYIYMCMCVCLCIILVFGLHILY